MAWQTSKTNWQAADVVSKDDFNRIEGNIQHLQDTKETPAGAQAKANAALNSAKAYTDQEVGEVSQALAAHKNAAAPHSGHETPVGAQAKADAAAGAVRAELDAHLSDYVLQVPYGVATGSANNYAVTLDPAPTAYVDGMAIAVKINVNNTGASTINVNGLGAKTIKKPNGNDVSAGNLKAGSIYSMRYNGTNFILQGSDAAGDATPEDVLSGKTFSSDVGTDLVGVMPNRGAVIITPSTANQAIAAGYHNGSGYVEGDADLVAGNIKNGASIFGVTGTFKSAILISDTVQTSADTERTVSNESYQKKKEIRIGFTGSVRVKWELWIQADYYLYYSLRVNNVEKKSGYAYNPSVSQWYSYSYDLVVSKDNLIQLYLFVESQYRPGKVRNFRICYTVQEAVSDVVTLD